MSNNLRFISPSLYISNADFSFCCKIYIIIVFHAMGLGSWLLGVAVGTTKYLAMMMDGPGPAIIIIYIII